MYMIGAIVVLYNPSVNEIKHIKDYYYNVDKTIILDNSANSYLNQISLILDNTEKLVYKHFSHNIGLCAALNIGMKILNEQGYEWALLMDSDSLFITNIIAIYKDYLSTNTDKHVAVLAPVHIHDRNLDGKFKGKQIVKWAMTSGCLYNIKIFERVAGFKEELFVDGLDIDYCYKIKKFGYKVIKFADAKLRHFPGETKNIKVFGQKLNYGIASPWRYYMQARAIVWLILKYRSFNDVIRYISKWIKVILLFDKKIEYILKMMQGSKEGFVLWKEDLKSKK